jgi:hypothetical protein
MYLQLYQRPVQSSEDEHRMELAHFSQRTDWRSFDKKTDKEREKLKTYIATTAELTSKRRVAPVQRPVEEDVHRVVDLVP